VKIKTSLSQKKYMTIDYSHTINGIWL